MSKSDENAKRPITAKTIGAALTTPIVIIGSSAITDAAMASTIDANVNNDVGSASSANSASASHSTTVQQSIYTVQPGDSLVSIAKNFSLSLAELLNLNQLAQSALIYPGQVIRLVGDTVEPSVVTKMVGPTKHTVTSGETLSSIAQRYELRLVVLLAINNLNEKSLIYPGQVLQLREVVPQGSASVVKRKANEHTVADGETLTSIAKAHGVSLSALLKANQLTKTSLIFVGQILDLPEQTVAGAWVEQEFGNTIGKPTNVCLFHGFHKIKSGETISRLAAKFGVTQQALLSANRLTWNSTIFIGQKLIVPGKHGALDCPELTQLSDEMKANATQIIKVGRDLGIPDYGIVIALATAMQESSLRNITFGDRDSIGLFQQRPSAHWGTKQQIMDANYSIRAFFGGASSPTHGVARGLLDISNWHTLPLTEAAQAVQVSAHPTAYAKWEPSAWKWLIELDSLEDS
jgi:LysM repeat protein